MSVDVAKLQIEVESLKVRQAADDLDRLTRSGGKAEKQASGLRSTFGGFGSLLTTLSIGAVAKQFYDVNAEFQRLDAVLNTLEGDSRAAAVAFGLLEKFAADTPYQLNEVVQAYAQLKARGLDATIESLRTYGDLSAAFGRTLEESILAVGQAVTGENENLKKFGIVARIEGDKLAVTFHGATTRIANNTKSIEAYLLSLAKSNFGSAMKKQMDTVGGATSNLVDAWQALLRTVGGTGGGDIMLGPIKELTDWLGRARGAMQELGQDRSFALLVVEVGNAVEAVSQLTSDVASLGGAMGEAGIRGGVFVRVLQGIQLGIQAIRAIVQGTASLYLLALESMAGGTIRFAELLQNFPKIGKAMGLTPEMVSQAKADFIGIQRWANEAGQKSADSFGNAWEGMLDGFESSTARAEARVAEFKRKLDEARGDQSGVGLAPPAGKPSLTQGQESKIREARNALREFGLETLKSLGLIDEWRQKEENLLVKIQPLGPALQARVRDMFEQIRATEELNKENELAAQLADRRLVVLRQQEAADRASAEAIRSVADPMREYRLHLQNINELLDQEMINEKQARVARAEAAASIPKDALTAKQQEAVEQERLNALYAAGALSADAYARKMYELALQGEGAAGHIARAFDTVTNHMTQAFANFVTTGKASFKDLVASILADLARMYAQKAFAQLMMMAIGAAFGGGGSTASSGSMASQYGGWGAAIAGSRAGGGSVSGGLPYLVGERGPEVYVPRGSGSIVPNNALGGSTINITNNNNFYGGERSNERSGGGSSNEEAKQIGDSLFAVMDQWAIKQLRPNGLLNPSRRM